MNNNILKFLIKESVVTSLLEGQFEKRKYTLRQAVDQIKNRVIIFFDTETTGLSPKAYYRLITEIAAVAYDTSTGERLGEYNKKAILSRAVHNRMKYEKERVAAGTWDEKQPDPAKKRKTLEDILKMTAYEEGDTPKIEEKEMMQGFLDFVNQFSDRNPILCAHNAKFDMYQIGKALEVSGLPKMPTYRVVDSLILSRNYLTPLLQAQEGAAKGAGQDVDPDAAKILKILRPDNRRFVNRLGDLGKAFEVDTKHWHSAIADTEQLAGILAKMVQYFEGHQDIELPPMPPPRPRRR